MERVPVRPGHGRHAVFGGGYEKRFNRELQHKGLDTFRASLLSGMPEAPDHFARCSDINARVPQSWGSWQLQGRFRLPKWSSGSKKGGYP